MLENCIECLDDKEEQGINSDCVSVSVHYVEKILLCLTQANMMNCIIYGNIPVQRSGSICVHAW